MQKYKLFSRQTKKGAKKCTEAVKFCSLKAELCSKEARQAFCRSQTSVFERFCTRKSMSSKPLSRQCFL